MSKSHPMRDTNIGSMNSIPGISRQKSLEREIIISVKRIFPAGCSRLCTRVTNLNLLDKENGRFNVQVGLC